MIPKRKVPVLTIRTPSEITPQIRNFAARLTGDDQPNFIDITPTDHAQIGKCHRNVGALVEKRGGRCLFGWSLWISSRGWLEAIFHSVWLSPDGRHIDVTPDPDGEERRLFVVDRTRRWEGRCIPTARHPLTTNSTVVGVCRMFDKADEIQSQYAEGEPLSMSDSKAVACIRLGASMVAAGVASFKPVQQMPKSRKRKPRAKPRRKKRRRKNK